MIRSSSRAAIPGRAVNPDDAFRDTQGLEIRSVAGRGHSNPFYLLLIDRHVPKISVRAVIFIFLCFFHGQPKVFPWVLPSIDRRRRDKNGAFGSRIAAPRAKNVVNLVQPSVVGSMVRVTHSNHPGLGKSLWRCGIGTRCLTLVVKRLGAAAAVWTASSTSPLSSSTIWFYHNLQDRGDCQNTRKSYKTSQIVGWVVG
jgi:hypothetical protein